VWDLDEESHWKKTAEWKAHKGSVWKVEWAHPEFGQVIASCSVDRSICIWEEGEEEGTSSPSPPLGLRAATRVLIVQVICAAQ
jgi:WD40 repeat protein